MQDHNKYNAIALALAWPETLCKESGAWYDHVMTLFGINKKGYYAVGHAAVVLIDKKDGLCRYFDFGRYHAPHGYGRVRDDITDHDLRIKTQAEISDDGKYIVNLQEILSELHPNKSTHGNGKIYSCYTEVNFKKAFSAALEMQGKEFIPYGPFLINGSNCSRFVNQVLKAGQPSFIEKLLLSFPFMITPTPMWNLFSIKKRNQIVCFPCEEKLTEALNYNTLNIS